MIFFLFLLKAEAVLTSTHNLCFGAKIRKIGIPLHTPDCMKVGFKGVFIARTCFPDGHHNCQANKPIINTRVKPLYRELPRVYRGILLSIKNSDRHIHVPIQGNNGNLRLYNLHNSLRIQCQMVPLWPVPSSEL